MICCFRRLKLIVPKRASVFNDELTCVYNPILGLHEK
jgi:hypothetical protein